MNSNRTDKIVANWVFIGVGMLVVQVLLGGITRLTGSGLSITEWKPIMGAMPPMSESEWQKVFEQYRQIAQYKYINNHFTLGDFKFIFFWEWFHRLWARLIGVVFLIPFVYFILKKYFQKWMINPLVILFFLGGVQGLLGWIMVKSGLNDENVYVNHIKLAIHFLAAMVLICYALVFGLMIIVKPGERLVHAPLKKLAVLIVVLISFQLMYGAFMAGLKAAQAAATWPTINGEFFPTTMMQDGFFDSLFFNRLAIHFIHRNLAYLIFILVGIWWYKARKAKASGVFNKIKNWPFVLVLIQVVLGILAVVNSTGIIAGKISVFEWFALLHQLTGMLLLLSFVASLYLLKIKK